MIIKAGNSIAGNFLAFLGSVLVHRVTFGDFIAGHFLVDALDKVLKSFVLRCLNCEIARQDSA